MLRVQLSVLVLSVGLSQSIFAMGTKSELQEARIQHAQELLGRAFHSKVKKNEMSAEQIEKFVKETTARFLPKKFKSQSSKTASAILKAAAEYRMDPVFLMAVIQNESSFNPERKGSVGEIGLMQIRPATAEWIANLYKIPYSGEKSLFDPAQNVKIGAAFLDKLRDQFDSESALYVSAYNIGAQKVRNMVKQQVQPKEYVQAVMKRYLAMYSAIKSAREPAKQSELAWHKVREVTQKPSLKNASMKSLASNSNVSRAIAREAFIQ